MNGGWVYTDCHGESEMKIPDSFRCFEQELETRLKCLGFAIGANSESSVKWRGLPSAASGESAA
jgi:hypothetical protein